jgi:hypothetical protein
MNIGRTYKDFNKYTGFAIPFKKIQTENLDFFILVLRMAFESMKNDPHRVSQRKERNSLEDICTITCIMTVPYISEKSYDRKFCRYISSLLMFSSKRSLLDTSFSAYKRINGFDPCHRKILSF